jgi:hypothetical protein
LEELPDVDGITVSALSAYRGDHFRIDLWDRPVVDANIPNDSMEFIMFAHITLTYLSWGVLENLSRKLRPNGLMLVQGINDPASFFQFLDAPNPGKFSTRVVGFLSPEGGHYFGRSFESKLQGAGIPYIEKDRRSYCEIIGFSKVNLYRSKYGVTADELGTAFIHDHCVMEIKAN